MSSGLSESMYIGSEHINMKDNDLEKGWQVFFFFSPCEGPDSKLEGHITFKM